MRAGSTPLQPFAPGNAGDIHRSIADGAAGAVGLRAAYVHVPFCFHKCHYCDFYSFVETKGREGAFVDRLLEEARAWSDLVDRSAPLETLFVGGGTPTHLSPELLRRLLEGLRAIFPWRADAEWTVEANPETVDDAVAGALAGAGVNRVSLGCQSFDPAMLKALERWHDPESVGRAVERLRRAGIGNLNLDLIFAIPGQTPDGWRRDLDRALSLEPDHLSCYGLVYESNTALTMRRDRGEVTPIDDEIEARMYRFARERLADAGWDHYEISNWARPGRRCRHNELYWTDADWLALGPSASGRAGSIRWKNAPRLGQWLEHAPFSPLGSAERVTERQRSGERFMLGLRRIEGLPAQEVERLLDAGDDGASRFAAIERACRDGLLERSNGRLRFTPHGLLLADSVLADLV